jgi:hypothetical protein
MSMNRLKTALACLLVFLLGLPLLAQRVPTNFSIINFRNVAPENVEAYTAFVKDLGKKLNQSRVNSGEIKSWSFLKLTSPYPVNSDHNFATVVSFDHFPELDRSDSEAAAMFAKAGIPFADYTKRSRELSKGVGQQITRTLLRIGKAETGDFVRVDYHVVAPERQAELLELEESVYAPMDQARIEESAGFKSWSVSLPFLPVAAESGWNFYTTQVFKDSASLGRGNRTNDELFKKLYPNRNYLTTMERIRAIDKVVKVRIYRVLETVGAPVMPSMPGTN